jgi:hypothetical protein
MKYDIWQIFGLFSTYLFCLSFDYLLLEQKCTFGKMFSCYNSIYCWYSKMSVSIRYLKIKEIMSWKLFFQRTKICAYVLVCELGIRTKLLSVYCRSHQSIVMFSYHLFACNNRSSFTWGQFFTQSKRSSTKLTFYLSIWITNFFISKAIISKIVKFKETYADLKVYLSIGGWDVKSFGFDAVTNPDDKNVKIELW